ncbi:MAG: acetylglutamate kinase [Lentisphaeria bacterium]
MDRLIEKAAVLMEALPYIQEFRDSIVVVKFGGSVMEDPEKTRGVIRDIVFMECAGMRPIVVHGGGKAISAKVKEAGIQPRFIQGLRYTDDNTIKIVDDVLHNQVNANLVELMREFNGHPLAVSGKDILTAERKTATDSDTGAALDLGHVGAVTAVDTEKIRTALDTRCVPIITPLAKGEDGTLYNVNADMTACQIAAHLRARKLAFLSDVPGILRDAADNTSRISSMHVHDVEQAIADGVIGSGMVPKVRSAADAVLAGTSKVHMIDGRVQHSLLLEIFTKRGIGTQIIADTVTN